MSNLAAVPTCAASAGANEDPSELTVKLLSRELANLRQIMEARMDGSDKIVGLLQGALQARPDVITKEVGHLKVLHEEKFASIDTQFKERDTRAEQTSKDSKVAVDAALQAAKEAVGEQNKSSALAIAKSETATAKQLDQIGINIQTTTANLNDKIDDVKVRLLTLDGKLIGGNANKDDHRSNLAVGIAALGALVAIGALIFAERQPAPAPVAVVAPVAAPQIIYVPAQPAAPAPLAINK
jgi:hypothetical protein